MRSSSPLMSYRQVLETRQRGLTELEVSALLNQLLVELAKSHAIGLTHGDLSLESLWRDVRGDLYMNPPSGISLQSTPRSDVAAIATVAIELLTNQPPSPHWQKHCSINPDLAEVLEQARSDFSLNAPQDASQLLQAIYAVEHPQPPELPVPEGRKGCNPMPLVRGAGTFFQKIIKGILVLGILSGAGWYAYEHFSTLMFEKFPIPRPTESPSPSDSPSPKPSGKANNPDRSIVISPKSEDSEP
jgi:serine/threonine protein kinase